MGNPFWSDLAKAELDEVIYFIGVTRRRPETAIRLYFEIRDAVNDFFQRGKRGHAHPALPAGWLYVKIKRWLVAYETIDGEEIIHRIVDASRDLEKVFEEDR